MRTLHQFMIVLGMSLMLCGQSLAGVMMWCCPPAGTHGMVQLHDQHQEHQGHALAGVVHDAHQQHGASDSAASAEMQHEELGVFMATFGCDHHCEFCAAAGLLMNAVLVVDESPPMSTPSMSSALLPDAGPSLPFRPPIAA